MNTNKIKKVKFPWDLEDFNKWARLLRDCEQKTKSNSPPKSETELAKHQIEFSSFFENTPVPMVLLDAELRAKRVNRTFTDYVMRSADEMIGLRVGEAIRCRHSLDDPRGCGFAPSCEKCSFRHNVLEVFDTGQNHFRTEAKLQLARAGKQENLTLLISTNLIKLSNEQMVLVGIENISDQKRMEDALWTSVRQWRATFDAINDAICIIDLDGKILRCNQAMIKLLGKLQKEIIGRTIWQLMFGKPESIEDCPLARMLKTRSRETKVLAKDDHWLQITVDPLTDEHNNLIGGIQIISDITERKQAEEEIRRLNLELKEKLEERTKELKQTYEKLSAAKERFYQAQKMESIGMVAGGVAHDFNNFLTTILGNIAIAKMFLIPEDRIFKTLTKAEKAALQAEDIAQQLLVFSSGGKSVKKVVAIKELIKDSVSFALRGANVNCEFSISEDIWSIEVDEKQIRQVIYSLITNAKQAMPEGGTIKVHCENVTIGAEDHPPLTAGEYIKLLITDQGIGIPKENLAKIFDPFFTTKPNRSGFGLANAYFIIQKHGGYIDVESEEAIGSIFHIYLPAVEKGVIQAVTEKSKTDETPESTEIIIPPAVSTATQTIKGKILVMDDEADVRDTVGAILNLFGYVVEFACDGVKAIELYKKAKEDGKPFDGVILDLTIPGGMGGKETIKRLLEIDPNVKAIVSSGYSDDPVMADFSKYGFSGVAPKPYSIDELIKTTGKVVNGITEFSSTVSHNCQPPKPLP